MKLCKFTARVNGELTKSHHLWTLNTHHRPCTDLNLWPTAYQPLLLPLRNFLQLAAIFVLNLNRVNYSFWYLGFSLILSLKKVSMKTPYVKNISMLHMGWLCLVMTYFWCRIQPQFRPLWSTCNLPPAPLVWWRHSPNTSRASTHPPPAQKSTYHDVKVFCKFIYYNRYTQVEVPSGKDLWSDESNIWSDHPWPKYPLIRLKCARNTVCTRSALETVSDQNFPNGKDVWSNQNHTIARTICAQNHHWSDSIALKTVWSVNGFRYERILV